MEDNADLDLLVEAALEAGALATRLQDQGVKSWNKSDKSPVSDADLAVDQAIRARLTVERPAYGWLSEESEPSDTGHGRLFVVDPIDGTRAYLAGRDTWTISLAVLERGQPAVGVVYNPRRDELYTATRTSPTKVNGLSSSVAHRASLAGATLAGGAGVYTTAKLFETLSPEPVYIGATSMALRLCMVASGACDATVSLSGKSDWDLAAGILLVERAGGRVTNCKGEKIHIGLRQRHECLVAANPTLNAEIVERLARERKSAR